MKQKFFTLWSLLSRYVLEYKKTTFGVLIIVCALGYYFLTGTEAVAVTYQYTVVKKGSLSSMVSATGQVTPNSQVELKPKVNANVTAVYVRAGDKVKAGQVLFRLDATDAYKQVRDAKTSLLAANLSLEKLRNPKTADILSVTNSLKQEEDSLKNEDTKVATAYRNLLNSGIQAVPEGNFTTETAPTVTGSYQKSAEGTIKIAVYQGGVSGYSFSYSGLAQGTGDVNTNVAQPIGDTGLYIKWNSTNPQTNWIINLPNKQSSGYSSAYSSWQNAVTSRDMAIASSERTVTSLKQKLADLTPGDDNLDVQSAKLTVLQRENALLDAQQTLSNYTLTAPFDGTMASVSVDIGSSAVMASSNSSAALGTIVTDKKLAQITLNEADVVKVKLGQKATVTFDAIEGLSIEGTIVEINTLGTVTSGVVSYKVKVAFAADDIRILPNMSVSVDIATDSKDDVLYIPSQALKKDADGYYVEKDGSQNTGRAFGDASSTLMRASSTASSSRMRMGTSTRRMPVATQNASVEGVTLTRVPVLIGMQTDTQSEIISGLSEGERIVLKKVTVTGSTSASAPSITSLLRPQQGQRTTSGQTGAAVRAQ